MTDFVANLPLLWILGGAIFLTFIRYVLKGVKNPNAQGISDFCDTVCFVIILAFFVIRPFIAQAFYIPSESMTNTLLVNDRLFVDRFTYRFAAPKVGDIIVFDAPPAATNGKKLDFIKRCVAVSGDTIEVQPPRIMDGDREIDALSATGMDWHHLFREILTGPEGSIKFLSSGVQVNGNEPISLLMFQDLLRVKTKAYVELNGLSPTTSMVQQVIDAGTKLKIQPGKTIVNNKVAVEPFTREDPDYVLPSTTLGPTEIYMFGDNRNFSHDSHMWGGLEKSRIVGKAQAIWWPLLRMKVISL